jgi:hypothetical protein
MALSRRPLEGKKLVLSTHAYGAELYPMVYPTFHVMWLLNLNVDDRRQSALVWLFTSQVRQIDCLHLQQP